MTDLGENFVCEARAIGDRHWCGRCNLDFASADKSRPACRPAADIGRVLPALATAAENEAQSIDLTIEATFNCARALQGGVVEPRRDLLRQAASMRKLAWLAQACAADPGIVERLRRAAAK
jgi:hypothetical protein